VITDAGCEVMGVDYSHIKGVVRKTLFGSVEVLLQTSQAWYRARYCVACPDADCSLVELVILPIVFAGAIDKIMFIYLVLRIVRLAGVAPGSRFWIWCMPVIHW